MPVIAAILFIVAYNMSEWRRFLHIIRTASFSEILVLVATFLLTVIFDLVVAIAVGLILTAFLFMKKMADGANVRAIDSSSDHSLPEHTVVYEMSGPMFFAVADKFLDLPRVDGVKAMILSAHGVSMLDCSTVKNFEKIITECEIDGITPIVEGASESVIAVLKKNAIVDRIGEQAFVPDMPSAIALAQTIVDKIEG